MGHFLTKGFSADTTHMGSAKRQQLLSTRIHFISTELDFKLYCYWKCAQIYPRTHYADENEVHVDTLGPTFVHVVCKMSSIAH